MFGQAVVVVPTERAALVGVPMCAHPLERYEDRLAGFVGFAESDAPTFGDETDLLFAAPDPKLLYPPHTKIEEWIVRKFV